MTMKLLNLFLFYSIFFYRNLACCLHVTPTQKRLGSQAMAPISIYNHITVCDNELETLHGNKVHVENKNNTGDKC